MVLISQKKKRKKKEKEKDMVLIFAFNKPHEEESHLYKCLGVLSFDKTQGGLCILS